MTERLLTLAAAADGLGCSLTTVKRRIAAGQLPVFRDGRLVRVRESDLRAFVAQRVERRMPGAVVSAGVTVRGRLWD